jgi:hypothetical protein
VGRTRAGVNALSETVFAGGDTHSTENPLPMRREDIPAITGGLRTRPNLQATLFRCAASVDAGADAAARHWRSEAEDAEALVLELSESLRKAERKLRAVEQSPAIDPSAFSAATTYVCLLAEPTGYRLVSIDDPPPATDEAVEIEGFEYVVLRLTPSPFPGDSRRCAILTPRFERRVRERLG